MCSRCMLSALPVCTVSMLSALPVCSLRMLLTLNAHDPGRDAPAITKQQVDCVLQQVPFTPCMWDPASIAPVSYPAQLGTGLILQQ